MMDRQKERQHLDRWLKEQEWIWPKRILILLAIPLFGLFMSIVSCSITGKWPTWNGPTDDRYCARCD